MPIVLQYGSLNLLESSGSVQACNDFALPLTSNSGMAIGYEFSEVHSLTSSYLSPLSRLRSVPLSIMLGVLPPHA